MKPFRWQRPSVRRTILAGIKRRTLLVLGQLDYAILHPAWEELIADLPYLTFVLLDKDGHNRKTEAPERFDRELIQWLSDLEEAEALKSDPRDS